MRVLALAKRIIKQFTHDKRSIALMFVAPIVVLTILSLIFSGNSITPEIGVVNSDQLPAGLIGGDAEFTYFDSNSEADTALKDGSIDAYISPDLENKKLLVYFEGSDPAVTQASVKWLQEQASSLTPEASSSLTIEKQYLYGSGDMSLIDSFGPVLVGLFAFFFVFLLSGIAFLRERTSGTIDRLMCSPMKLWEIVAGYVLGYGFFAVLQSILISLFSIYVLDLMMEGSLLLVIVVTLLLAISALTLGLLLSSFAKNELQMIQFIPLVIVPAVFFSGIFNLESMPDAISWIGMLTPLYYAAEALQNIMIKGYGISQIYLELIALIGFSALFMSLNILTLKKYRKG